MAESESRGVGAVFKQNPTQQLVFFFLLSLCEENPEVFLTQGQSRLLFLLQCLGLQCA